MTNTCTRETFQAPTRISDTGLMLYRKLAECRHTFSSGEYYSLNAVARLVGMNETEVRRRAEKDRWAFLPVFEDAESQRRRLILDGGYIGGIQEKAKRHLAGEQLDSAEASSRFKRIKDAINEDSSND